MQESEANEAEISHVLIAEHIFPEYFSFFVLF